MEHRFDDAGEGTRRDPAVVSGITSARPPNADHLDHIRRRVREGAYDSPRIAEELARRLLERGAL